MVFFCDFLMPYINRSCGPILEFRRGVGAVSLATIPIKVLLLLFTRNDFIQTFVVVDNGVKDIEMSEL